jgi:hypothetical protein
MTDWLSPLRSALDALDREVEIFFRDDDAGWEDDRLFALLDLFATKRCPVDLAVIPAAVTESLARRVLNLKHAGCAIGLHQHGFAHANYEPDGRPCEFGPARPEALQRRDIEEGRRRLAAHFGDDVDPLFTPPWNRCTAATGRSLVEHGISTLSRDASAGRLGTPGLTECPIRVDWFAKSKGRRLPLDEWSAVLSRHIADPSAPVGVMLHHAAMDRDELDACDQLLDTVTRHPRVRVVPMREAAVAS